MKTTLDQFSAAILTHDVEVAAALFTPETRDNLHIYLNHYPSTLLGLLEDLYPVTARLLEANFRLFAWRFVRQRPPSEASLDLYGAEFATFLSTQPEIMATQPALAGFAYLDLMNHHLRAPKHLTLKLPAQLPAHYASVARTGALLDAPLGPPKMFRLERSR